VTESSKPQNPRPADVLRGPATEKADSAVREPRTGVGDFSDRDERRAGGPTGRTSASPSERHEPGAVSGGGQDETADERTREQAPDDDIGGGEPPPQGKRRCHTRGHAERDRVDEEPWWTGASRRSREKSETFFTRLDRVIREFEREADHLDVDMREFRAWARDAFHWWATRPGPGRPDIFRSSTPRDPWPSLRRLIADWPRSALRLKLAAISLLIQLVNDQLDQWATNDLQDTSPYEEGLDD